MLKQKNVLSIMILSLLCICLLIPIFFQSTANVYANDELEISSKEDLIAFSKNVNNGTTYKDTTVKLTKDIELDPNKNFVPIGNENHYFQGIFDGQGYTIKNLTIKNPGPYSYIGLFGKIYANNTEIKNLTLTNVNIEGNVFDDLYAGAVVGYCYVTHIENTYDSSRIENVAVRSGSIKITTNNGNVAVGGIIGGTNLSYNNRDFTESYGATSSIIIEYSYSNLTLNAGDKESCFAGGILGKGIADISNCFSLGNALVGSTDVPKGNNNVLYIKFNYYCIDNKFTVIGLGEGDLCYSSKKVFDILTTTGQNKGKDNWYLEDPDNPESDGEVVLKGVGYYATHPLPSSEPETPPETPVSTSATIKVLNRYYDITTNTKKDIPSTTEITNPRTIEIKKDEIFTITPYTQYNQSLSGLGLPYYEFVKEGEDPIPIPNETLKIKREHITYVENGYSSLYVYYINGTPITINNKKFWICSSSDKLYKYSNNSFSIFNDDLSSLIPTDIGLKFLGWSVQDPGENVCEFVDNTIDGNYIDWRIDYDLVIKANRANMQTKTDDSRYKITSFSVDKTNTIFQFSNANLNLYEVYGDFKYRCYTSVYKEINDVLTEISTVTIKASDSTLTRHKNYYRVDKDTEYNFSLINQKGIDVKEGNGYTSIKWYLGNINIEDNTITKYNNGERYGTINESTGDTTTVSNISTETRILAVLTPRQKINISILSNEFNGSDDVKYKINNEDFTSDTRLTYGEIYTITAENMPSGWVINLAKITRAGSEDDIIETPINYDGETCTFTVDFNVDGIVVNLDLKEGMLSNIISYAFISLLVVAGATLLLTLIINTFKPDGAKNSTT